MISKDLNFLITGHMLNCKSAMYMQHSLSACPKHENVLYKGRIISQKSSDLWEGYRHPKIVMGKKLSGYSEAKVQAIITVHCII